MPYIHRHIESAITNPLYQKGAIAVTGARQTGKSTMLSHLLGGTKTVTLDDLRERERAVLSPDEFIADLGTPVFIDEIQRAPQLLSYIKIIVDKRKEDGLYYLSGSQKFSMMKDMSESLAGRVAVYELLGLSMREICGDGFHTPFMPSLPYIAARQPMEYDVWEHIHKGFMPELYDRERDWGKFYSDYVSTYLERDVSQLSEVGDSLKFYKFMQCLAARIGNLLNLADVCKDVGNLSQPTADRWLSILRTSDIVYLLPPFHTNEINRAVKTPKLYFFDTGLAAHLARWDTKDVLKSGAMSGAYFENFVVMEILKSHCNAGIEPKNLYFYRDKEKNEIDLLIHKDGALHPIEIKKHSGAAKEDTVHFRVLEKLQGATPGDGCVIYTGNRVVTLGEHVRAIPVWYI
jgi:predicted AAA+ superfamily ATPase